MTDKQPLQYTTLTYVGKEYKRKFDNDDGSVTKSYATLWKENENQQFPIKFWAYDSTKGFDILDEGEVYTIGYVTRPNNQNPEHPIKVARFFGEPNENTQSSVTVKGNTPQQPQSNVTPVTDGEIPRELNSWASELMQQADGFKQSFVNEKPFDHALNVTAFYEWVKGPDSKTTFFDQYPEAHDDKNMTKCENIRKVFVTLCQRMGLQ